jgi:hypothetical protein
MKAGDRVKITNRAYQQDHGKAGTLAIDAGCLAVHLDEGGVLGVGEDDIRRVMSALGQRKSKAKAKAARANGAKGGRPPKKPR